MRIIHTIPSISNEASGPSYSVVRLCETLIQYGQEVTLLALDWAPIPTTPSFLKTFPLGFGPKRLGRSPWMKKWLIKEACLSTFDLIHNHSLWMMPNVYPGQIARKYNIPYVLSPRGVFTQYAMAIGSKIKRIFWPLIQRPALSSVICFHATAESEYADIRRIGFSQPVAILPNGVDIPELKIKKSTNFRTLLFLGRIHPNKGLELLLPAWREVQERFKDWRLRIVGPDNGGYLKQVRKMANQLQLERIDISGPLYGSRKWEAYTQADLFILPSYSENFGMSVAEALASGTPAIVTKGAPWAGLETHKAGWWIDIGIEPLVACLENALALSSEQLSVMGSLGREWMKRDFSWKVIGSKMLELYNWIIQQGQRPDFVRVD